jgi:hypothetical protein
LPKQKALGSLDKPGNDQYGCQNQYRQRRRQNQDKVVIREHLTIASSIKDRNGLALPAPRLQSDSLRQLFVHLGVRRQELLQCPMPDLCHPDSNLEK